MSKSKSSFLDRISRVGVLAVMLALGFALIVPDADAGRRLGGGRSFGRQSESVTQRQAQPPARDAAAPSRQNEQTAPAANPQTGRRWGGILGGLAAGLGIAALLSYLGLAGPLAQMLGSVIMVALLALAAMFVWRMLRGARARPALEPAHTPMQRGPEPMAAAPSVLRTGEARPGSLAATLGGTSAGTGLRAEPTASPANWSVPADFDTEGFLRSAKVHYLRLQAAWHAKNLDDIREFTTPEVFAEIRMQLTEDPQTGRTDVDDLGAELLGVETTEQDYLASVRFFGTARDGETSERFEEVWNLSKPLRGKGGWVLAGIQQL
jgi:predicted lipid-binding transport protein (Tim44 family)